MRNERGLSLVELLAVLALIGIITTLIITVFINGSKASDRSTTNQRLQQEANYIVESIRKEYLKNEVGEFKLHIDKSNKSLKIGDVITISEGYDYKFLDKDGKSKLDEYRDPVLTIPINRNDSVYFGLKISKGNLFYTVETKFSKLR